jgi:hypothetical protein
VRLLAAISSGETPVSLRRRERGSLKSEKASSHDPNSEELAAAAERLRGTVKTAVLDAHDETALETFFSRLEVVDHLVSMVGDSMG